MFLTDLFNAIARNPFRRHGKAVNLRVDLHSHLLPGVDDGAKTMEESIDMIQRMKTMGYKKLITTPHIMSHRYPNSASALRQKLQELKAELKRRGIGIKLELAAEYYLDEHLLELIRRKEILTFGNNYLLFEMSYVSQPVNLAFVIKEMETAGYQPVLAHPERYQFMHTQFEKYRALKELGVLFQVNLNSLSGYYSEEAKQAAVRLFEKRMVDFVGSDAHKMGHLRRLEETLNKPHTARLLNRCQFLNDSLLA